jgi:hypothetical protein
MKPAAKKSKQDDEKPDDSLNAQDEIKLKKIHKLLEKFKSEYKSCDHKLHKIERAIKKATEEDNKPAIKKCEKYKIKYEEKVDQLKRKIKLCKLKINELSDNSKSNNLLINKTNGLKRKESSDSLKDADNKQPTNGTANKPQENKTPQTLIKIPFPVSVLKINTINIKFK